MFWGELIQSHGEIALIFALLVGHALGDYPLQGDFLAGWKNRHLPPPAGMPKTLWIHCLTAHATIHGGLVFLITGNLFLGLAEVVLHWIIDYAKCSKWINYHIDQLLHISCKVAYVIVLTQMGS